MEPMEPLPLKDIHLPSAVGYWPPAPGWWLVLIGLPLLVFASIYLYRRLTRKTALKTAKKLLAALRQQPVDNRQTLIQLSAILRRTAISRNPRATVASLSGAEWLRYLDGDFADAPFSQGIGHYLADGHYRPQAPDDADIAALFALCERWLKQQEKTP